jgi:hypothetical protein
MLYDIATHNISCGITYLFCAILRRVSGQRISLSNVLTMDEKVGLCVLSFCQQSNISW